MKKTYLLDKNKFFIFLGVQRYLTLSKIVHDKCICILIFIHISRATSVKCQENKSTFLIDNAILLLCNLNHHFYHLKYQFL